MEQRVRSELASFLRESKVKTFASRASFPRLNSDGSKEYKYQKGLWLYLDKYFGSIVDTGQERVFYNGRLIWSMSYRGGMRGNYEFLSKRCFSFLKKCLREAPFDFPVRGPRIFQESDFFYENLWRGDLEDFVGEEKIFLKGDQIYFRNYLGGTGCPRSESNFP